jgi:hypothetical protein
LFAGRGDPVITLWVAMAKRFAASQSDISPRIVVATVLKPKFQAVATTIRGDMSARDDELF